MIFLEAKKEKPKTVPYKDLSSDIILGINRIVTIDGVSQIKLQSNEVENKYKKQQILPYINDNLWITSDLHLNHENRNSLNFRWEMVNEINEKCQPEDAIMFLGDMGKKNDLNQKQYLKEFMEQLNVRTRILILGNHDILSLDDWYDIGFSFVTDKLQVGKYLFSHYPLPISNDQYNFHGHIHEAFEYWNVKPKKHINCYIHSHNDQIYTLYDYIQFFKQNKYKHKYVKK